MCNLWRDFNKLLTERHKDCPLVELPPHGDLIDREWLIGIAELAKQEYGEAVVDLDDLYNAPTVLEAEV